MREMFEHDALAWGVSGDGGGGTTTQPLPRPAHRREELREFLRNRRARLTPDDVGLPPGLRRRTPGLRREEVAVLAGVGVSWYIWLEQGRDIKVSERVLDGIADALRLDGAERAHLYRLAGMNPPPVHAPEEPGPHAELERLLLAWLPNPAYVLDRHWDFVRINAAARAVFGFTDGDTNCLVAFFTKDGLRSCYRSWARNAPHVVAAFREDAARYPDDPGFARVIEWLRGRSQEFDELWSRHEVRGSAIGTEAVSHPLAGCLYFEQTHLRLADRDDLRLVLHAPRPGTGTDAALRALVDRVSESGGSCAPSSCTQDTKQVGR